MTDQRKDLPSDSASNFTQRVRETLMTYMGRQGDPLDRGLTLRDLIDAGLLAIKDGAVLRLGSGTLPIKPGSAVTSGTDNVNVNVNTGTGTGTEYVPDLTPPPTPTGFTATAGITSVIMESATQYYTQGHGHMRTVVYGAIYTSGALPTFSDAVKIAEFEGTVFSYSTNPSTEWHLWAKWQSKDGVLSVDPFGGTNGVVVTTGQDVSLLLDALTGQITASQLYIDLGSRIDLIDGNGVGSVNSRIQVEVLDRAASVLSESNARTLSDTAITGALDSLDIAVGANAAGILTVSNQAVSDTASVASVTDTLAASHGSNVAAIVAARATSADADASLSSQVVSLASQSSSSAAALTTAQQAYSDTSSALSQQVTTLAASTNTNNAAIVAEQSARTSDTGSLATQVLDLAAETGSNTAGLFLEQTARTDAQGALASQLSGLAASTGANSAGLISEQTARADAQGAVVSQLLGLGAAAGTNAAGVIAEQTARADANGALASQVTTLGAQAGTSAAAIQSVQETQSTNDRSLASSIRTLQTTVEGQTAALSTESTTRANADGSLFAEYTVKTDLAGFVSGFGLASEGNPKSETDPSSAFGVRANRFWVAPPSVASATEPVASGSGVAWGTYLPRCLAYGKAMIVGGEAGHVAIGGDALNWINQTGLANTGFETAAVTAIAANNDCYLAFGDAGKMAYSQDGVSWTYSTALSSSAFGATAVRSAIWTGTYFYIMGAGGQLAATAGVAVGSSVSSISFATASTGIDFTSWVWDGKQLVAGTSSGTVYTSPDGGVWTQQTSFPTASWASNRVNAIVFTGSVYVAVGNAGKIATSPDGVTWTNQTALSSSIPVVLWNGSYFLFAVSSGGVVTATFNAASNAFVYPTTTSGATAPTSPAVRDVWINSADGSYNYWTGLAWVTFTQITSLAGWMATTPEAGLYRSGLFVLVGGAGKMVYSGDGVAWSSSDVFATASSIYEGYVWVDTSVTPNVTRYRKAGAWVTTSPYLPFVIQATPTVINGLPVPAGVYMDAAYIRNATITGAKIANLAVDDAKISSLSVTKLVAGTINTGDINSTGTTVVGGTAVPSFKINGFTGYAEFNNVTIRGTVYASAGQIGGNTIDSTGVQSNGYTYGTTGWRLDTSGLIKAFASSGSRVLDMSATGTQPVLKVGTAISVLANGTASFGGDLDAAGGTFKGSLTADAINAVNTVNIAGRAVTVPSTLTQLQPVPKVLVTQQTDPFSAWQTVCTLNVDFGSVAPELVAVFGYVNLLTDSGAGGATLFCRVLETTTSSAIPAAGVYSNSSTTISVSGGIVAGSGARSFALQVTRDTSSISFRLGDANITIFGAKR